MYFWRKLPNKKILNALEELIENMMAEDANLTEKVTVIELVRKTRKSS